MRFVRSIVAQAVAAALLTLALASSAVAEGPRRIVSIGGSVTEIIFALGEQERIAAVDTTSIYPAAATELPDVGYMRALSAEGVLAVEPDLVLALEGAGPPPAIAVLAQASVPMIEVAEEHSPEGVAGKIATVAAALGREEAGKALAAQAQRGFDEAASLTSGIEQRKRVLFVLSNAGGRLMVAGTDTAADAMITLAGADNAITGFSGYKPASGEAVAAADPDAVLMMSRGEHASSDILSQPALASTAAARSGSLIVMDGLYLLGFGPRTGHAVRDLALKLYPELGPRAGQ